MPREGRGMTTTCATRGAEVADPTARPPGGTRAPPPRSGDQSADQWGDSAPPFDWRTATAEPPAVRAPVEPVPAAGLPTPPRFPLYADETEESVSAHVEVTPSPSPY